MKANQKPKKSSIMNHLAAKKQAAKSPTPPKAEVTKAGKYKQAHYDAISKLSTSDKNEVAAIIKSNSRLLQD